MAEINNTQWLEEYLKMWTPKERMGRIHKVTTFDPTYHCYPEGVYLLDDDCRAHTAIYVVDKNHNVHIIYDGMAWDLLARAVERGLLEISLKLSEGDKGLVAVLERMLAAQNTCCAGLQSKLKKIGDELERIADAVEGGAKPKPKPDPDPEPKPEKKTLFLAEPDRHEVTEDKKVYTSAITSIVKDVPEQPWTITDDFADYPDWATVSTDKSHVYITTDGSKPGNGTNDPWGEEDDGNKTDSYGYEFNEVPVISEFKVTSPNHSVDFDHAPAQSVRTGQIKLECNVISDFEDYRVEGAPKPYSYIWNAKEAHKDDLSLSFGLKWDTDGSDSKTYNDNFKWDAPRITEIEPITLTTPKTLPEGWKEENAGLKIEYVPIVEVRYAFFGVTAAGDGFLRAHKFSRLPFDPDEELKDWKRFVSQYSLSYPKVPKMMTHLVGNADKLVKYPGNLFVHFIEKDQIDKLGANIGEINVRRR